jgi:hypothetical protein
MQQLARTDDQPNQTYEFREFMSLPAQWRKERRRRRCNNQSGRTMRGGGETTGRGAGRQKALA